MNIADIIEVATKAGTLPMQVLLLMAVIVLGWVVRHLHKQTQTTIDEWTNKLETKETAISQERKNRIEMLMEYIANDTEAKVKLAGAVDNVAAAIVDLRSLIKELKPSGRRA